MLVVVAAGTTDARMASDELVARGAAVVDQQAVGLDRVLVSAGSFDDSAVTGIVAQLRAEGWAAVVRPAGGGHLAAWQRHTRPVVVADRLWVCFPWSEFDRRDAPSVVEIDPGPAFGTGAHPSTRLLLTELAIRLKGGETVLDVGCGSGVLAVAAARLGAASVTAIDVSLDAVVATRANARRNGLAAMVEAQPWQPQELGRRFDVVVANMDAATLINLAPVLQSRLARGGWLGLSGLSRAQPSMVAASFSHLQAVSSPTDDDWAAMVAVWRDDPREARLST